MQCKRKHLELIRLNRNVMASIIATEPIVHIIEFLKRRIDYNVDIVTINKAAKTQILIQLLSGSYCV